MAYDLQIGSATVYMEASGEPPEGQRAVVWVLVNRLRDGRWGPSLASVCLYPEQFSAWNTNDPNRGRLAQAADTDPTLQQITQYLQNALDGTDTDPTGGALYYFAPALAMPSWASKFTKLIDIGNQSYYTDK